MIIIDFHIILKIYVAWEPLPAFRKLVLEVLSFQGTWELVGNFPNPMRIIPYGWELARNFYPLKSETLGLFLKGFLHRELPHIP